MHARAHSLLFNELKSSKKKLELICPEVSNI